MAGRAWTCRSSPLLHFREINTSYYGQQSRKIERRHDNGFLEFYSVYVSWYLHDRGMQESDAGNRTGDQLSV